MPKPAEEKFQTLQNSITSKDWLRIYQNVESFPSAQMVPEVIQKFEEILILIVNDAGAIREEKAALFALVLQRLSNRSSWNNHTLQIGDTCLWEQLATKAAQKNSNESYYAERAIYTALDKIEGTPQGSVQQKFRNVAQQLATLAVKLKTEKGSSLLRYFIEYHAEKVLAAAKDPGSNMLILTNARFFMASVPQGHEIFAPNKWIGIQDAPKKVKLLLEGFLCANAFMTHQHECSQVPIYIAAQNGNAETIFATLKLLYQFKLNDVKYLPVYTVALHVLLQTILKEARHENLATINAMLDYLGSFWWSGLETGLYSNLKAMLQEQMRLSSDLESQLDHFNRHKLGKATTNNSPSPMLS